MYTQGVPRYRKQNDLPPVWHVDDFGDDAKERKPNLYYFAQKIFRPKTGE